MAGKTRKILLLTFAMITVVLVATMLYSINEYIGMFRAVRSLTISVQDFAFGILDLTSAVTTTTLTVNNTSPQEFLAIGIQQRIEMNGIFYIGTSWKEGVTNSNPYKIAPDSCSNITLTLNLNLITLGSSNPELVELFFDSSTEKNWQIQVFMFLEGSLLGRYTMRTARTISTY